MTKERLWQIIVERNPGINRQVTLAPGQVKKLFSLVWEKAFEEGADHSSRLMASTDFIRDLFGGLR